MLWGFKVVTCD